MENTPPSDYNRVKHMDMIQAVVSRLAANSFSIKGWSVTLVTALFGLSASSKTPFIGLLGIVPVSMLWGLDGFYLKQERQYRALFNKVVAGEIKDWTMNASNVVVTGVHVSRTILLFYGMLWALCVVIPLVMDWFLKG